jgi:hypothetical protein
MVRHARATIGRTHIIGTTSLQRRQFLTGLGAASATTLLPPAFITGALVTDAFAGTYKPRRIDVHHHAPPPAYADWMAQGNATFRSPLDTGTWSLDSTLADMDKYGIETSIVSSPDLNGRLPGVAELSGPKHILFGTDDPYVKVPDTDAGIKALHLPPALRAAVDRENALPLFPRFNKKA